MKKWKKFLSLEAGIELKACLYFAIILFYYFLYCILTGTLYASIILMSEIVLTAYAMSYLQVYLLQNFDESEHFNVKTAAKTLACATIYTTVSYILYWFDRNKGATLCFFFYMLLCYACVFLLYKLRRITDTEQLNQQLERFKQQKENSKS